MKVDFQVHPSSYRHWQLSVKDDVAWLFMKVDENAGVAPGYRLKLNSYDLGVDIELADAIQRIRFEHTNIKCVVITSEQDRIFCAGANIFMLGKSAHAFKVNFCKFTNETRLAIEDASQNSGIRFLCAANGTTAGGGYELALACDEIMLIDDGNSAVSLPEVPLLGVLPGTGGLTRLVDKRKVRKDLADIFCTLAEGIKGDRAKEWGLVDHVVPKSEWKDKIQAHARSLATKSTRMNAMPMKLEPVRPYKYVQVEENAEKRMVHLVINGPTKNEPMTPGAINECGSELWALRVWREIDDAMLNLRFHHPQTGLIVLKTKGDPKNILTAEKALMDAATGGNGFAREVMLYMKRVLKRIDLTSRSFAACVESDSAFAGSLCELLWASDRSFMLRESIDNPKIYPSELSFGVLPMSNGLTRLQSRYFGAPETVDAIVRSSKDGVLDAAACQRFGLITTILDAIDYEDEVRLYFEERASLSPDALTGMEASLRFPGPETMESKIFSRLSAWQNWIFIRDNATGPSGALTSYGSPLRPQFDFERC